MRHVHRKNSHKVLLTVALVAAAAGVAGLGTFGTFTSTTSASTTATTGTVAIALGPTGTAYYSADVTGLVPGDSVQRALKVSNTGDAQIGSVTLTTLATASSVLDSDTANGLKMKIESCSVPWAETSASSRTYTCSGTTSSVYDGPIITSKNLGIKDTLNAGNDSYLRFTGSLPTSADNTFQGKSSTIKFTFDATQRAGKAL